MKPTVLQLGPLLPLVEKGLAANYAVLNLAAAPDAAAFLAENGPRIDAIASSGRNGVNAALVDACPNLKLIAHFGVGYDNVDVEHARKKGVVVSNTPDVLTDCVADLAIALLIDAARGISAGDRYVRAGRWLKGPMPLATKVTGKRMGIVGLGRIGRAIAARAEGFDMEIRYHNRRQSPDAALRLRALARGARALVRFPGGRHRRRGGDPRAHLGRRDRGAGHRRASS